MQWALALPMILIFVRDRDYVRNSASNNRMCVPFLYSRELARSAIITAALIDSGLFI